MTTPGNKNEVIKHLIHLQKTAISNARRAMDEAQEEANNYGTPKDRYDGFRNQQLRRKDMFAKQLSQAGQNLELLRKPEILEPKNEVAFGALVQTNTDVFFISIGLGAVSFNSGQIIVISMLVPIFQVMKGKKVGDSFSFNNRDYTIKSIT